MSFVPPYENEAGGRIERGERRLFMKKIKNPWYCALWIIVWTASVIWLVNSGHFNREECIGLVLAWLVMVGVLGYCFVQSLWFKPADAGTGSDHPSTPTARNAACPCGSGKKYKRCCGQTAGG